MQIRSREAARCRHGIATRRTFFVDRADLNRLMPERLVVCGRQRPIIAQQWGVAWNRGAWSVGSGAGTKKGAV